MKTPSEIADAVLPVATGSVGWESTLLDVALVRAGMIEGLRYAHKLALSQVPSMIAVLTEEKIEELEKNT